MENFKDFPHLKLQSMFETWCFKTWYFKIIPENSIILSPIYIDKVKNLTNALHLVDVKTMPTNQVSPVW